MNEDFTLIHSYTRREAIEDGVLIEVTDTAKEFGFRLPIALTSTAWETCITVPPGVTGQDERGRLCDVLWMLVVAIRTSGGDVDELRYELHVRSDNEADDPPLVELKAVCGPNDDGTPCITVMLPDED